MLSPAAEWVVQDLGIDADGVTTRRDAAPGQHERRAPTDHPRYPPSRFRRYSAISSVQVMPCGMALVSDTNAWI
jgi:hypothetical protein